jgi:hypothetical protein
MSPKAHRPNAAALAVSLCLTLGAAGCAMDDVQFNGGVFDAVGLSDASKKKSGEPKLAERAPLVVPPTLDNLPAPGEENPQAAQIAEIQDPDAAKKASKEELERQQAEYCKVNYEDAKMRGDDSTALNATGPLGPCRPSALTAFTKWNSEESEGE